MRSDSPRDLRIPGGPVIPASELRWRATGSGGPGGQHANTSNTKVEVTFDVASSSALSEEEKERIVEHLGRLIRVVAAEERSQFRNRVLAAERLSSRLAEALVVPEERRPTKPSRGEIERRRKQRQQGQERKRQRRWSYGEEE